MGNFRWLKKPKEEGNIKTKFEITLDRIKKTLEDLEGVGAEEVLIELEQIIPPKVIIKEVEPQTTEEERQYMKDWRKNKKILDNIKDKETQKQEKINKALQREKQLCFKCGELVKVINPTHEIVKKRNRTHRSIIVSFTCSNCGKIVKYNGGKI